VPSQLVLNLHQSVLDMHRLTMARAVLVADLTEVATQQQINVHDRRLRAGHA